MLFLVDLTGSPERALNRLEEMRSGRTVEDAVIALIDARSLPHISRALTLGLSGACYPADPPDALVECVRRALAHRERLQRNERLRAVVPLYQVAQSFATVTDLDTLLEHILDTAIRETDADRGSIMLVEPNTEVMRIRAAVGLPPEVVHRQRQRVGEGIAGWVAAHARPLILTEGELPPFTLPWLRGRNAYSSVSVPLIYRGQVLGVLNLTKTMGKAPFREGDLEMITVLASQAAIAIRNARLFAELQQAYEQLQRLDHLRSEFIDIAAHEMRTPVSVLTGYVELLAEMELPELAPFVAPLLRNVRRLQTIVHDLFQMSTLRALERGVHPEPVNVHPWLGGLMEAHRAEAQRKGIRLEVNVVAGLEVVVIDPDQVGTILGHLLTNALKFTPSGGQVQVTLTADEEHITLYVDDSGPGIPAEEREHVFDPFYQLEPSLTRTHEGLGLGLSIAQALARAHGGTLHVQDSPLGGARLTLTLPRQTS